MTAALTRIDRTAERDEAAIRSNPEIDASPTVFPGMQLAHFAARRPPRAPAKRGIFKEPVRDLTGKPRTFLEHALGTLHLPPTMVAFLDADQSIRESVR